MKEWLAQVGNLSGAEVPKDRVRIKSGLVEKCLMVQ